MKVSVLAENTALCSEFGAEHGLSLYIETKGKKILFDMGQTALFVCNAKKLGIDLSEADLAVLSHGHYDHGGGLGAFFEQNSSAKVYLSRYAFEEHYNAEDKYIGLDKSFYREERFEFCEGITQISVGITLFGGKGKEMPKTLGARGMKVLEKGRLAGDDFRHEQYLLIEEDGRRYLFSGCSHRGASEIAEYFKPDVFIGGFHYSKVNPETAEGRALLEAEARALLKAGCRYYTCHCTGTEQFEFLKQIMGEKLYYISGGDRVDIDSVLGK